MSEVAVVCGKLYILLRVDSKQVYNSEKGCIFFRICKEKNLLKELMGATYILMSNVHFFFVPVIICS